MASRPIFEPRKPTRQDILDMIGDQGEGHWRNPVHLRAVTGKWPKKADVPEDKERRIINEMAEPGERPFVRNGSLGGK